MGFWRENWRTLSVILPKEFVDEFHEYCRKRNTNANELLKDFVIQMLRGKPDIAVAEKVKIRSIVK